MIDCKECSTRAGGFRGRPPVVAGLPGPGAGGARRRGRRLGRGARRLLPVLLLVLLLSRRGCGQAAGPPARPDSIVVAKAYPLLGLFAARPALRQALRANAGLRAPGRRQARAVRLLVAKRPAERRRGVDSLAWSPAEVRAVGRALAQVSAADTAFRAATRALLRARYPRYAPLPDTAALRLAWQDAALGINRILRVYLANQVPRYPAIDSSRFRRQDVALGPALRRQLRARRARGPRREAAFYDGPLRAALAALQLNGRDEAARYEPLAGGLNAAPRAAVARTEWARFPYSVILVPGQGPEGPGVALDSVGAYRCRLAAARYRAGQAPFVVVSGGHVHPNQTPYCEAVEMKKYLVGALGVPAAAVFVEPYARHTTTNLRNTGRLLYAFGLPPDKPLLTVTDAGQSRYILGLAGRCRQELGYVPYRDLRRVSDVENACWPVPDVAQPDPFDPLDP